MFKKLKKIFKFPIFIISGPLQGMWWFPNFGNAGHVLGTYEAKARKEIQKHIQLGDVVYDVGAHVGFYTLFFAKKVGAKGRVFAFEPLHKNFLFLKKHIALNKLQNVSLFELAVSEKNSIAPFLEGGDAFQGHLSSEGESVVSCVALDSFLFEKKISPPEILKIDVEGGEYKVLLGAKELLNKHNPVILLETHGEVVERNCVDFLNSLGYMVERIQPHQFIAKPR